MPEDNSLFLERKNELLQAGFKLATEPLRPLSWAGQICQACQVWGLKYTHTMYMVPLVLIPVLFKSVSSGKNVVQCDQNGQGLANVLEHSLQQQSSVHE